MHCEIYECRNCFYSGQLNLRLRCERCDSDKVISLEVISLLLHKQQLVDSSPNTLAFMGMGTA